MSQGNFYPCYFFPNGFFCRVLIKYLLPLAEILTDFHDQLKSRTAGYASFDYEETGYQVSDLVKVNFFLNGKPVDALASVMHRSQSERMAKNGVKKLKAIMERYFIFSFNFIFFD